MAQRRMFSKSVIETDSFLDLPVSSRELYFQLGMYADDDGFVAPKKVIRTVGASEDDLKVLIFKGFVIPFESGVIVIRHWGLNNFIAKDRYTHTVHIEEYKQALLDDVYKMYTERQQIVDKMSTQVRIGKDSKDKTTFKKFSYKGQEARRNYGKWELLERGGWITFTGREEEIKEN